MTDPKSVAGVIFSSNGVLLIQRRDVPVWVLPGGGIDPGEPAESAITREILEETGLTVKIERIVGDYFPINRLSKRTLLYECSHISGELTLSSETKGIRFFPLDQLPPMPPPYLEWILDAREKGPMLQKKLTSVTYLNLVKLAISHPILVGRFLLARAGLPINT
jgi:8-oxo-dGTP diphosphatase